MKHKYIHLLIILFISLCSGTAYNVYGEQKVDFEYIKSLALKLSKENYKPNEFKIPDDIRKKDYSEIMQVGCNIDNALWKKEGFPYFISFAPMLSLYNKAVNLYEVENGIAKQIQFDKNDFVYGKSGISPDELPKHYTGFKIYSSKNNKELMVFQGASYFRPLPPGSSYGLSLRGISINTVMGDKKEDFPDFTDFWLVKPEKGSDNLKFFALLNSDSITGAYEFVFKCQEKELIIDVNSTVILKKNVDQIGFAPITSLFWFDKNTGSYFERFQPGDHNSDGLITHGDNIYTWQPLVNYLGKPAVDSYNRFNKLDYFGLLQRERSFEATVDWINKDWANPNVWIKLKNDTGPGFVRLVTTPTHWEYTDNVNTFWIPIIKMTK